MRPLDPNHHDSGAVLAEPAPKPARRPVPRTDPAAAVAPAPSVSPAPQPVRFWMVVASHVVVDIYPIIWATLVIVLRRDLDLTGFQVGTVYAAAAVVSGLPQGLAAWASDRFDTRFCAWAGLVLSAVCMSSMGFAQNFAQLLALIVVGNIGNAMYHPIGAALAGQVGGRVLRGGRAVAVSIFFAAGMVGSILGPLLSTELTERFGRAHLGWLMVPGLVMALMLHLAVRGVGHRAHDHHAVNAAIDPAEARRRWRTVGTLFAGNCLRFIVNTAMFVLFPVWAKARFPGDDAAAAYRATDLNRSLIIAMTIGMGIFAIFAARLVRQGHERRAIFILGTLGAVFTALTGFVGTHLGVLAMQVCAGLSGLGFAAILPITIALAQRLLPGRTGLASGLMMGVAWSTAALAPAFSIAFLGFTDLNIADQLPYWRIDLAFIGFGVILFVAGWLALFMPADLLRKVAAHR